MSILNSIKSFGAVDAGSSLLLDSGSYRGGTPEWYFDRNGDAHHFSWKGQDSSLTAYRKCPPVTAIINKKAQAFINGKTWVLNSQKKESSSPEAKKLKALMAKPNSLQTWKQFEAQAYIYQQLFGYTIILPIKPFGFPNIDATALWNIPPFMVNMEETKKLFYTTDTKGIISKVVLTYKGERTTLNIEDIYIMKDFTPSFDSLIIPESRIRSLEMPINNIMGAYESRNVLINSRGPMYVVSSNESDASGNTPLPPGEKNSLLTEFKQRYGLTRHQSQAIITNANIKVESVGFSTKDLLLFEEVEGSTMALCDGYGYPYRLLAAEKSASYNDVKEFRKELYENAIIPEAESMYEQWNQFFNTSAFNLILDKDFAHIAALQQDAARTATARRTLGQELDLEFKSNWITLNRVLELLGEDTVSWGNSYYKDLIAQGYVFGTVNMNNQNNNQDGNANQNSGQ